MARVALVSEDMQRYLDQAKTSMPKIKGNPPVMYLKALGLACEDLKAARQEVAQDRRAMLAALMQEDTETIERFLREYHKHLWLSPAETTDNAPGASESQGDTSPPGGLGTEQDGGASSLDEGDPDLDGSIACPNCRRPMTFISKEDIGTVTPFSRYCEPCGYSESR